MAYDKVKVLSKMVGVLPIRSSAYRVDGARCRSLANRVGDE